MTDESGEKRRKVEGRERWRDRKGRRRKWKKFERSERRRGRVRGKVREWRKKRGNLGWPNLPLYTVYFLLLFPFVQYTSYKDR